jgi:hypothetical protein
MREWSVYSVKKHETVGKVTAPNIWTAEKEAQILYGDLQHLRLTAVIAPVVHSVAACGASR